VLEEWWRGGGKEDRQSGPEGGREGGREGGMVRRWFYARKRREGGTEGGRGRTKNRGSRSRTFLSSGVWSLRREMLCMCEEK